MINRLYTATCRMLLLIMLLFSTNAFGQSAKMNWNRMQRDLNIMESILDKLLSGNGSLHPVIAGSRNSGAKGLYFDGYGVVFQVDLGGGLYNVAMYRAQESMLAAEELLQQAKKKELPKPPKSENEPVVVVDGGSGLVIDEDDLSLENRIEHLKEQSVEFLSDYADAIGQLKDSHRITLLLNFEQRHSVFRVITGRVRVTEDRTEELPSGLEITAKKSDIVDLRKGKISKKSFQDRIVFKERLDSNQSNKNIEIMSNILSTALDRKYQEEFSSESKNRGIYLSGLGALFFMRGQLFQEREMIAYEYYLEKYLREEDEARAAGVAPKAKEKAPEDRIDETLTAFKHELIELVGDYGHTLRTIKPAEHVVISIDFDDRWRHNLKTPEHIILKVKKVELEKYDRGELSLTALRKKVEVQEY